MQPYSVGLNLCLICFFYLSYFFMFHFFVWKISDYETPDVENLMHFLNMLHACCPACCFLHPYKWEVSKLLKVAKWMPMPPVDKNRLNQDFFFFVVAKGLQCFMFYTSFACRALIFTKSSCHVNFLC